MLQHIIYSGSRETATALCRKKTFHIKQMLTCTSANVIYCIRCSRCGPLYIGETKQRLGDHFVEHPRSVRNKQLHLPVANHFNS
eukprot:g28440.t1